MSSSKISNAASRPSVMILPIQKSAGYFNFPSLLLPYRICLIREEVSRQIIRKEPRGWFCRVYTFRDDLGIISFFGLRAQGQRRVRKTPPDSKPPFMPNCVLKSVESTYFGRSMVRFDDLDVAHSTTSSSLLNNPHLLSIMYEGDCLRDSEKRSQGVILRA